MTNRGSIPLADTWPADRRTAFADMWWDRTVSIAEIARAMGISEGAKRRSAKVLDLPTRRTDGDKPVAATTVRACLRCRQDFPSEGKRNRLCKWCRRVASGATETYRAVLPGARL